MATFTTIALETLLEPRIGDSCGNPLNSKDIRSDSVVKRDGGDGDKKSNGETKLNHVYFRPALYVTPVQTPIPESSLESVSPSPYVVNRKRRGGGGGKNARLRVDGFEVEERRKVEEDDEIELENGEEEEIGGDLGEESNEGFEADDDDFLEPRCDSFSNADSDELNVYGKQIENPNLVLNQSDFFDADEEFSSDGSTSSLSSHNQTIEKEKRSLRLALLHEIERRKTAEESLSLMTNRWKKIADSLSQAGFNFPFPGNLASEMETDFDSKIGEFCEEIVAARSVAKATGKDEARTEAEAAAGEILRIKDQEICRLQDRLQYHVSVNHEMSRRNQEIIEVARRQRRKKNRQRRWLWGCLGFSIAIGASIVAYSSFPQTTKPQSLPSSDNSSLIHSSDSA